MSHDPIYSHERCFNEGKRKKLCVLKPPKREKKHCNKLTQHEDNNHHNSYSQTSNNIFCNSLEENHLNMPLNRNIFLIEHINIIPFSFPWCKETKSQSVEIQNQPTVSLNTRDPDKNIYPRMVFHIHPHHMTNTLSHDQHPIT